MSFESQPWSVVPLRRGVLMRRPSVLVIFLTVFIDLIGFGIVVPLIPSYSEHFGARGVVIGVIFASFSAMQFIFSPIWGRLSDRHGRRPILAHQHRGGGSVIRAVRAEHGIAEPLPRRCG